MERIRPAAVAGAFYPGGREQLAAVVDRLLDAPPTSRAELIEGVIAPHAGYVYSGPVAGTAYAALKARAPKSRRFLLLGPAHFVAVHGMAHPEASALETPLGRVAIDEEVLAAVAGLPHVQGSAEAHRKEHCLEVQLPFLQRAFGDDLRVTPLVVGHAQPEDVADLIDTAVALGAFPIISSDLSHYLPYEEARERDAQTARQIEALEAPLPRESACGARAIDGMLLVAQRNGLVVEPLDLRNSGDTAGGRDQVVGYGAFAFRRREGVEGVKEE